MSEEKELGEIDERKLSRKIDLHILPGLTLLLLLAFLDQGNSELPPCFISPPSAHLFSRKCPHRGPTPGHTHECAFFSMSTPCQHVPHHSLNKLEASSLRRCRPAPLRVSCLRSHAISSSSSRLHDSGFQRSLFCGESPVPSQASLKVSVGSSPPASFWVWQKAGLSLESCSI